MANWKLTSTLILGFGLVCAQNMPFNPGEDFLTLVEPLITKEEKQIYDSLSNYNDRDYFEAIFWVKRNPDPANAGNPFKKAYFERRQQQINRFRDGAVPGHKTERGRIFLLLGEPDDVVATTSASGVYQEEWQYESRNLKFRFLLEPNSNRFRLDVSDAPQDMMENLKRSFILDRAESYRLQKIPISLPNVGSTKDIENLVAEDRSDFPADVVYSFVQGDNNQTQVLVHLTLPQAGLRGLEVNLTVFDPYENKVIDFKKRMDYEPGKTQTFSVVVEPDQYEFVMRIRDNKGNVSVQRQVQDVPRLVLGLEGFSSLIGGGQLERIPLEGFHEPRLFVVGDRYFRPQSYWPQPPQQAYLMQVVYGQSALPSAIWVSGTRLERPELTKTAWGENDTRWVIALPPGSLKASNPEVRVAYSMGNGLERTFSYRFGQAPPPAANQPDRVRWVLPDPPKAEAMGIVQIETESKVDQVDLLLNGRLIYTRNQAPWRFVLDDGLYSISGKNILTAVCKAAGQSYSSQLELSPLRADESVKTRAIQVFFNAFDQDLKFLKDLDLDSVKLEVDGEAQTPVELVRVDDPITYCFLVDVSASMKEAFFTNMDALRRFIENIRPIDQGYCIAFSDNYAQFNQPTTHKGVLLAAAAGLAPESLKPNQSDAIYAENTTYLYDAAIAGIHSLVQYPGRKVMVIISDGIGTEGKFSKNALWNYAAENDVVIYSLWIDNNPQLTTEDQQFLAKEMGSGERFARWIGLSRFFANKDHRKNIIREKINYTSINEGTLKSLAEDSGGFHYRIFKTDRNLVKTYVEDISSAVGSQYRATLTLPVSDKRQEVDVYSEDESVAIRCKSAIKVRKTNPLSD
ncbi:MAG: GWxTD domain-containing protein [Acidobacteria bacterium]|nr:GWxTD domain-containing protein [Acidobacteriota bacterium]MCB9396884.1 GWxTD domain-containing protein [Acidobacteriota bacterium]